MRIIGLTGSIGMGKTTTADMFRSFGVPVFDADAVVHSLYQNDKQLIEQIERLFPNTTNKGFVDRKILSDQLRKSPNRLRDIERLVHPRVRACRDEFVQKAEDEKHPLVVFDIPLLFETGSKHEVDLVLVCAAPRYVQYERVMKRSDMNLNLFLMILSRQMPNRIKCRHADIVIMTDLGLEHARNRVKASINILSDHS